MARKILVFGAAGIDSIYRVASVPSAGESVYDGDYRITPGGAGLIAALTMRAFGFETLLSTRVGEDENGERIVAALSDEGVETKYVSFDPLHPTPHTVFLHENDNPASERRMYFRDSLGNMTVSSVKEAFRSLPDAVFLQLDVPSEIAAAVADEAAERSVPLFVNPGHCDGGFDYSVFDGYTFEIFTPDEEETIRLTGSPLRSQEDCMRACMRLARLVSAKYYVVKLGERGCFLYDGTYCQLVTPYEVGITDRAGVGEIFSAILAAEYLKNGGRINRALEYANAGAAISLTRTGGAASVPLYNEVVSVVSENLE